MKRVMIIGKSGAGKTVFADKLGKLLQREVIHLDKIYWKPNWEKAYTKDGWKEKMEELVIGNEWIIDGNYRNTLDIRLRRADTIIFFDLPTWLCLWYAIKRKFGPPNKADRHEGMEEKVSWELVWLTLTYPTAEVRKKLAEQKDKRVIVITSRGEMERILEKLGNESV